MMTIQEITNKIIEKAYQGNTSDVLLQRFHDMYDAILCIVKDEDMTEIVDYIIQKEIIEYNNILQNLETWNSKNVIYEYGTLILNMAIDRYNNKKVSKFAEYFYDIFYKFFKNYKDKDTMNPWYVSDMIVNINYACGKSNNMGLNLYHIVM